MSDRILHGELFVEVPILMHFIKSDRIAHDCGRRRVTLAAGTVPGHRSRCGSRNAFFFQVPC